jgi:hypothetical protein
VGFHESFWVVAGTAAPVIALAEIVTLVDAFRTHDAVTGLELARNPDRRFQFLVEAQSAFRSLFGGRVVGYVNILLQVAILALALECLASRRDVAPLAIVSIGEPFALVLLLVSAAWVSMAQRRAQRIRWSLPE